MQILEKFRNQWTLLTLSWLQLGSIEECYLINAGVRWVSSEIEGAYEPLRVENFESAFAEGPFWFLAGLYAETSEVPIEYPDVATCRDVRSVDCCQIVQNNPSFLPFNFV